MKKLLCLIYLGTVLSSALFGQVGINDDGSDPDPSAMLDVKAADKGVLITRVALTSTLDVLTISNPQESMIVYNTTTVNDVIPGYYYWDGSLWVRLLTWVNNDGDWDIIYPGPNMRSGIGILDIGIGKNPPYNARLDIMGNAWTHGISIKSTVWDGIFIENNGWNGISIRNTGANGIFVNGAAGIIGMDGVRINGTTSDGVFIDGATAPIGRDGVNINGTVRYGIGIGGGIGSHGINISGTIGNGILVNGALDPITLNGIEITKVNNNGIHIHDLENPGVGKHGISISGINHGNGILIEGKTGSQMPLNGIEIIGTGGHGLFINGAPRNIGLCGIAITGINYNDAIWIDGATSPIVGNGIQINGVDQHAIFINGFAKRIGGDGIHMYGIPYGDGIFINGAQSQIGESGIHINGTADRGIYINGFTSQIGSNGIEINGTSGRGILIDGSASQIGSQGIEINGTSGKAILVNGATSPIGSHGLEINGTLGKAILVNGAASPIGSHGLEINGVPNGNGIFINGAQSQIGLNGIEINGVNQNGIEISSTDLLIGRHGVKILLTEDNDPDDFGIHSTNLGGGYAGYFYSNPDSADNLATIYVENQNYRYEGYAAEIYGQVYIDPGFHPDHGHQNTGLHVLGDGIIDSILIVDAINLGGNINGTPGSGGKIVIDNIEVSDEIMVQDDDDPDSRTTTINADGLVVSKTSGEVIAGGIKELAGNLGPPFGTLVGLVCSVFAEGGKSAIVTTESYGRRLLWADESTQVYFFDRGSAEIISGVDTIFIDPIFLECICDTCDYLVQITATQNCNGLYVHEKNASYFIIKELQSGTSNATYDWELQALRKDGWETLRLVEFLDPQ